MLPFISVREKCNVKRKSNALPRVLTKLCFILQAHLCSAVVLRTHYQLAFAPFRQKVTVKCV